MSYILGFGKHLPGRIVDNAEIAARIGRTPEWIESATGIRERRWAAPETTVADLAVAAAGNCIEKFAGVTPYTIRPGMIIVASGSAPPGFPGPAAEVATRLSSAFMCGENVPALDVPMASGGSLFAMVMASRFAESYGDVLVIGAEKMSAVVELGAPDPNTAILFGDGAGAALISSRPREGCWKVLDSVLHSDGEFRGDLRFNHSSALHMNGLSVIMQASRKLPSSILEVLRRQNVEPAQVAQFLVHQANQNLLVRVARAVCAPEHKFFSNIASYGNTSSASMLIAAAEWAEATSRQSGDGGIIVFAAFGAGFHWGALLAAPA
jgi:3-oxoacyl-[acyl-carrier-protein] synthase-3